VALLLVDPNLAPNFAPFPGLFHRHAKEVTSKTPELEHAVDARSADMIELATRFQRTI
jgi:hypothetical protein